MRRWGTFLLLLLLIPLGIFAQEWVELNGVRFVPEPNVELRGSSWRELGREQAVLVQFKAIPDAKEIARWESNGGKLLSYLGSNAYYAILPVTKVQNGLLRSVMPLKSEWKVAPELRSENRDAQDLANEVVQKVSLWFAATIPAEQIKETLSQLGHIITYSELFGTCMLEIAPTKIAKLAALPWVLTISQAEPEQELQNYSARLLGRAAVLNTPAQLGGRGLTGKGIRIGIWDGNVVWHPDFGKRVHVQEYESASGAPHGTHVAGSVLGAGVLDPLGCGMAPQAEAYTWNFNTGSNGLSMQQEMDISQYKYGITLTQNSYGWYVKQRCPVIRTLINAQSDYELDVLSCEIPTLTHVFSAGNDQWGCMKQTEEIWGVVNYGLAARRAKNVIHVGAVTEQGDMTDFSSWGPQDDGRVFPTVCAKGQQVLSVESLGTYYRESGTSMACPVVTGHLALLQERFKQLNNGQEIRNDLLRAVVANTADEAGRKGPDFQFGYGILNAERAVVSLEKRWWHTDKIANGEEKPLTISVPKGAKSLRVMLAWNDPPSKRARKYGEPIMINDLDLKVKVGSNSFLPWVLNTEKGKVEEVAQRKEDHLNNMEQVTLDMTELAGESSVEVSVTAKRVVSGSQDYVLTYWIEEDNGLRIVWPGEGDILEPEVQYRVMLEGVTDKYTLYYSADDGQSYISLGDGKSDFTYIVLQRQPATAKALLRLVDATGHAVTSGHFTVSPQITSLAIENTSCDYKNWKLTWKPSDKIDKYTTLLWNEEKSSWEIIQEGIAGTECMIPEAFAKRYERPIFAVAATTGVGTYGLRSEAVQGKVSKTVKGEQIPFVETFVQTPSTFLKELHRGKNMSIVYRAQTFVEDPPLGSSLIGCKLTDAPKTLPKDEEYFAPANADYSAVFELCNIDLTGKPDMRFLLEGALIDAVAATPGSARFKLEDNGTALASQYEHPNNIQKQHEDYSYWYFTLKGNQKHSLKLSFAGGFNGDAFAITRLAVLPFENELDLTLDEEERPQDKVRMGKEPYKVRVQNLSDVDAKDIEIRVYMNDELQATEKIAKLTAQNQTIVTFTLDFSTEFELGERKIIRCELLCKEDKKLGNNVLRSRVNNFGRVVVHEKTERRESPLLGLQKRDPKVTYHLKTPIIYTDNGGMISTYLRGEESTMKFLPPDPSLRVRVTFTEFNLVEDEAILAVFTNDVPEDLDIKKARIRKILTGELKDLPLTFVSDASDGGLTMHFLSYDNADLAPGWVAKVDFVPAANAVTLLSATATAQGTDKEGKVPVVAKVRNNYEHPVEVNLHVWDGSRNYYLSWYKQVLQPGENTVTFPEPFEVPFANSQLVEIYVESPEDYDASDNALPLIVGYDRYCFTGSIQNTNFYIAEMQLGLRKLNFPANSGRLMYMSKSDPFELYKESSEATVKFSFDGESDGLKDKFLTLWVDWNDNGLFDETEKVETALGEYDYTKTVRLSIPNETVPGVKRMRIIMGDKESVTKGACSTEGLLFGDMRDVFVKVIEGADPTIGDIALLEVNAGVSGHDCSNEQEVSVTLQNLASTAFKGKVTVKLSLDGEEKGTQVFDYAAKALNPEAKKTEKLTTKLDLTPAGTHKIKVEIDEQGSEKTKANNVKELEITSVKDAANAFRAIHLMGDTHEKANAEKLEYISMKSLGKSLGRKADVKRLFEMVVKMDKPANTFFLQSANTALRASYGLEGKTGVKDGSLVFLVGTRLLLKTKTPVLTPGVWQHIAVGLRDIEDPDGAFAGSCNVDVYINGEKVEVVKIGAEIPDFSNLQICRRFDGQIAFFRASSTTPRPTNAQELKSLKDDIFKYNLDKQSMIAEYRFNEVNGTATVFSRNKDKKTVYEGNLVLPDPSLLQETGTNAIWQDIPLNKMFYRVRLTNQTGPWVWDATKKQYVVKFPHAIDIEKLKTLKIEEVQTLWPGAKLEFNGVEETTLVGKEVDLSSGKSVKLKASCEVFGHKIEEEATIVAEIDKSDNYTPLSFKLLKEKNAGMSQDVSVDVKDLMYVDLDAATGIPSDLSKVVFELTLPTDAKATYLDQPFESGVTALDLRKVAYITVEAANGTKHQYEIRLRLGQTIENWSQEKLIYAYGTKVDAATNPFQAIATSQLPVAYISTNPNVVAIVDGELRILGVGEASVAPIQAGNEIYKPVKGAWRTIQVTRKEVTLQLKPKAYFDEPIAWNYQYDALVADADFYTMPSPWKLGAYKLLNSVGQEFSPEALLPFGKYMVEVKIPEYTTESYSVKPKGAEFEILPSKYYGALRCEVKNEKGDPLVGAQVGFNGAYHVTDSKGIIYLAFRKGISLDWVAVQEGYVSLRGTIAIAEDENSLEIVLKQPTFVAKYEIDATTPHGSLIGDLEQHLAVGTVGTMVRAVPEKGYLFDQWSDGKKEAVRQDSELKESVTLKAKFRPAIFKVQYQLTEGGKWKSEAALASQDVEGGKNAKPVEVEPADAEHYFIKWSDDKLTPAREEENVFADVTLVAEFGKYLPLPQAEDFEAGVFRKGWYPLTEGAKEGRFRIEYKPLQADNTHKVVLDGFFAASTSYFVEGGKVKSSLYSPRYKVASADKDLKLRYNFLFPYRKALTPPEAKVEYTLDGITWSKLKDIQRTGAGIFGFVPQKDELKIEKTELVGKTFIQFRWSYEAENDYSFLLDNVAIFAEEPAKQIVFNYISEPAEAGSFVEKKKTFIGTTETPITPPVSVELGTIPNTVKAIAKDGWKFVGWKETGSTDPEINFTLPATENTTYTALFRSTNKVLISYKAVYPAGGSFTVNGMPSTSQEIEVGKDAAPISVVENPGYKFVRWENGSTTKIRELKNVSEDMELVATFEKQEYPVTFIVEAEGLPIEKAVVKLGKDVLRTGADGRVVAMLTNGIYSYEVAAAGYKRIMADLEVKDRPLQVALNLKSKKLEEVVVVTLHVYSEDDDVVGNANVTLGTYETKKTNPGGVVVFNAAVNTNYTLKIEHPKFETLTNELVVAAEILEKTFKLVYKKYTVTLTAGQGGSIKAMIGKRTVNSGDVAHWDDRLIVAVLPDKGFKLATFRVNNEDKLAEVGEDNKYRMSVREAVTIEATFVSDGSAVEDMQFAGVVVAPNPFGAQLRIVCPTKGMLYELVDIQGVVVRTGILQESDTVLDTSELSQGIYHLRLRAQNGAVYTVRVVKE